MPTTKCQQFDLELICRRHDVDREELQLAINIYLHYMDEPTIAQRHKHLGDIDAALGRAIELCDGHYDIEPLITLQMQNYAKKHALPPVRTGRPPAPGRQLFLLHLMRIYSGHATMGKGTGNESPFFRFVRDVFNVVQPEARNDAIKNDFCRVKRHLKTVEIKP